MSLVRHKRRQFRRRKLNTEERVYESKSERQKVRSPFIPGENFMLIPVKSSKAIYKLPNLGQRGMENMRTVRMNLDTRLGIYLAADIPADLTTFFQDKNLTPRFRKTTSESRAPNARSRYDYINVRHVNRIT
jgi:hypothetical protein